MSRKSKRGLTPIPGLHRVVERELPLAVKVTGRHTGALAYLSSLAAERAGTRAGIAVRWNEDGSLKSAILADGKGAAEVFPGNYVYLFPGEKQLTVSGGEIYRLVYRPVGL